MEKGVVEYWKNKYGLFVLMRITHPSVPGQSIITTVKNKEKGEKIKDTLILNLIHDNSEPNIKPITQPSTHKARRVQGKTAKIDSSVILRTVKGNPRRSGTHGHHSWSLIKENMTIAEYLTAGGRKQDLNWDINKGYIKIKND